MEYHFKILFMGVLFLVSFLSDVVLNDFTRLPLKSWHSSDILNSLTSYFKNKSIVQSGVYAGVTVVMAYFLLMLLSNGVFPLRELVENSKKGILKSSNVTSLIHELLLAFVLGYVVDIFIHKTTIFGSSLNAYYAKAGAGLWAHWHLCLPFR